MSEAISDYCILKGGTGFPEIYQGKKDGDIPFIKVSDMSLPGNQRFIAVANNYVSTITARQLNANIFPEGATVFAKVGAALLLNRRRMLIAPTIIDNNMMAAVPTRADSKFLYYFFCSIDFLNYVQTGALPSINQTTIGDIQFPDFPMPSQRRIAEILSTVDEAIEQTEALIAKYQQIKVGMMHDLFTRGLGPDGRLRPSREEAPHLYQESPLGWIPGEWEVKTAADVCEMISVGIVVRPTQYYVSQGVPAFRSANVRESGIDFSDLVFISQEANTLLTKSQLRAGDVISVRTGYPGTSAVVPKEFAGMNCIDLLISRPLPFIRPEFFASWINSSFGKDQVLRKQGGLAQQHFNVGELRKLIVFLPSITEQDAILKRLATTTINIKNEQLLAEKLHLQKQGLMQDLLTGRVRVKETSLAQSE